MNQPRTATSHIHHTQVTPTAAGRPSRTLTVRGEAVPVLRLAPEPQRRSRTNRDLAEYIRAFTTGPARTTPTSQLPTRTIEAVARLTVDNPRRATAHIRAGLVASSTDVADVYKLETAVSPCTVLPGEQPRGATAGGRATQVPDPSPGSDPDADTLGLPVLRFRSPRHLTMWCADALTRSLEVADRCGRPQQIAATGTRQNITTHNVLVQFEDGTHQQEVLMVSDGISRTAVCQRAVLGLNDCDPTRAGLSIAETLIGQHLDTATRPDFLATHMARLHGQKVREYFVHDFEDGPDEHGIRLRQHLTIPASHHLLANDPETGLPRPMDQALEGVVADHHTGVEVWSTADRLRHDSRRALKAMVEDDVIDPTLFETSVLTDQRPGYGFAAGPAPRTVNRQPLRSAVDLFATLLDPAVYPHFKSALRRFTGRPRLTTAQTGEYIASVACQPWGANKPITRAWAYGGPALHALRETGLDPVHPDDYLDLVAVALHPKSAPTDARAARLELALAGGIALLADGVLTTAIVGGSGGSRTTLPFRGTVDQAVEALTRTPEGLLALAVSANSFDPACPSSRARLPQVDPGQPDCVRRDGTGHRVATTETILARLAALADPSQTVDEPAAVPETAADTLRNLASRLPADASALLERVELIRSLHQETGNSCGLGVDELDSAYDTIGRTLRTVGLLR